ncbi:MAG TPA: S41 family peptidase [Vicinamibacterales bacterium]|jgi:carboxyl-terminal processing protease|nr:S41 family peptidase [Vicinamibacterales bacterium]
MARYRSLSSLAGVVVVCAVLGGVLGREPVVAQDQVAEQYKVFTSALKAVEDVYVGETQSDRLVYGAISGMLQTLDPHSSFMDPKSYAQMRERQEGRYYGLGISIQVVGGDVTVVNVFEGSPAYQRGMRRGDVIAKIENDDTKGWTSDQAVGKLRGPRGTAVGISLRRAGYDKLIDVKVTRDEIHMPTVNAVFMIDATTGYVRVTDFGENTDQELGNALAALTKRGMKRLVFDLRANPGGALDQAIKVANRFLPRGDLIVSTHGRVQNSDQEYRATERSDYLRIPMITLVNRSSASASEIVSGALQDHDRSLVVGETTFGKALVQSVYRVAQSAGAAITTARYYTPSGRLIQRPWDGTFDEYLTYTLREQDPNKAHKPEDLKYTDGGRKVYSGGGVEPDRRFDGPVLGFNPSKLGRALYARNIFDTFAQRFSRKGDTRITPASNARELGPDFVVTDAMLAEFKEHVKSTAGLKIDEALWQQDLSFIKSMVRFEIDSDLFGIAVASENLAKVDPQLQFGLGLFNDAEQLLNLGRRNQTSRVAQR